MSRWRRRRNAGPDVDQPAERSGGVAGAYTHCHRLHPYRNPHNLGVGWFERIHSGNYAMENADLLIAIGPAPSASRAASRTGYPMCGGLSPDADLEDATHYHHTPGPGRGMCAGH